MSLIKPLDIKIIPGDLDTAGRPFQVLPEAHRTCLMSVEDGRVVGVDPHFHAPLGVASYYGFGQDGLYYEAGVAGRTWRERESIDDFTDRVTDPVRWGPAAGNPDLIEGGSDFNGAPPFGLRLHAPYGGPGAEVYDRRGAMIFTHPTSGTIAALSSRVTTRGPTAGMMLDNSALLGIQLDASDLDYIFVGYVNTVDYPFSVVKGHVLGGVPTVTGAVAIPPGTVELEIAIAVDSGAGTYTGRFDVAPVADDYTVGSWVDVGAPVALPAGFPANVAPRFHIAYPAGYIGEDPHAFSDCRVEAGGGVWEGQQRASWWLETLDGSRPLDDSGVNQEAPNRILVTWERDKDGANHLALVDVDDKDDPLLWRRWRNLPRWKPFTRGPTPFWSPGWMDAAQGHILMTRETGDAVTGPTGEVWVVSLRWDTIVVFSNAGVGRYPLVNDAATGRVIRESGSWGSRFWYPPDPNVYRPYDNYDHTRRPLAGSPFVGTLNHNLNEPVVPAITYGVHGKQCDDGVFYAAYGIQESPASLPAVAPCYAGIIALQEGPARAYERRLFQRSEPPELWDATDECWVGANVMHNRSVWWQQGVEEDPLTDLRGELCRRDWSIDAPDNDASAPYIENVQFGGLDRVGAACLNMFTLESNPVGSEVVMVATGWRGEGWGYVLWYDPADPGNSANKTYGYEAAALSFPNPSPDLSVLAPVDGFPGWYVYEHQIADAELDVCRISGSKLQGTPQPLQGGVQQPLLGQFEGQQVESAEPAEWLAYAKHAGQQALRRDYALLRGQRLNRGEFVLEVAAEWTPPWSFGDRFAAQKYLRTNQGASLRLFYETDRRMLAFVEWRITGTTGNNLDSVVDAFASATWYRPNGAVTNQSGSRPLASWSLQNLAPVRMRIKRTANALTMTVFDSNTGQFETVLQVDQPPSSPALYGLQATMDDAAGGPACGTYWRVSALGVAPSDDPLGGPFVRPMDYPILPSLGASVQGVVGSRSSFPTPAGSGVIVIAEGWPFGAIPPHP